MNAVERIILRQGPFADESFVPGLEQLEMLKRCKVLVIGAGGLGCEILKDLALSGFADIHVIDMDTIDISNLNRQFLFREADVGKPKATVAAEFVMKRVKGVNVTPYFGKIQDKDDDYYMEFQLVICGLDSVEARRWINAKLHDLVDGTNPESLKPLIDGGTEGFKGQARVILPTISSCYECTLDMLGQKKTFPICTIANTPRVAEHCIEWASIIEWPKHWPDTQLDTDDPEHILWLYNKASERAAEFNITGVTYSLTQGLVKNIIPAIASTNAIISAACVNEAFKIATNTNPFLDNYMMYTGDDGVYTYTFQHQQKRDCPVCGSDAGVISVKSEMLLQDFVDSLTTRPGINANKPSLSTGSRQLYMQSPPQLEEATRGNLEKPLGELIDGGEEIVITDPGLQFSIRVKVNFV
ncbi:NEDD8-activating enzyme E1 catalytic subunit [Trichomonascus vanleenenianus]|uniref:NEDD8-activating protein UBA3 n=1 Tax=Trichomonascus vanleenenianus TaxID=2268995 RepID=UPI003ECA1929